MMGLVNEENMERAHRIDVRRTVGLDVDEVNEAPAAGLMKLNMNLKASRDCDDQHEQQ